ncbi:hypothetical protein [Epilithonimonas sp.]|uniref:hypothetical protein n=1 Tax=Epilithonimonas sp. TaxID=2894511 RepID=UPI0035B379F7
MATPKGNAYAFTQLRPTEYKVGDIYSNMIDGMIKRGEAQKAVIAKRQQEENASLESALGKIDTKFVNTLPVFQDGLNSFGQKVVDLIYQAQTTSDLNQKRLLVGNAMRARADYEKAATFFSNPQSLESINNSLKMVSENKAFKGDKSYALLLSLTGGAAELNQMNDGRMGITFKENATQGLNDVKDITMPIDEALQVIRNVQEDTTPKTFEVLKGINTTLASEIDNGLVLTGGKKEAEDRMKASIKTYLGFDATKPISEQFDDINSISADAKHLFYKYKNRMPENGKDLEELLNNAYNYSLGYVDTENKSITHDSALDIALKRAELAKKKQDLQPKPDSQPITITPTNSTAPVQIKSDRGVVLGTQNWNVASFTLPKKKGIPTTDNVFGIAEVEDKNGKIQRINLIGAPSATGGFDYTRITSADAIKYAAKVGYTVDEYKAITQNAKPIVTKFNAKLLKAENEMSNVKNPSSKTQIIFKTKEYNQNKEDF